MHYLVIVALLLIFASLGSALFFLFRDTGNSSRMMRALALRVGLSIALFAALTLSYRFGLIEGKL